MTTASSQIETLRNELTAAFPERTSVIDGSLCAVLAGEHVLLLGPPGTAKSALVRAIAHAFSGRYFERLVTKFSTPEELFGPISLKALEQDKFSRVVTDKLPEAQFAFIDEIFKANSAILNSMLTLVNEKVFHNDGAPMKVPLVTMFGASNELPEGKELEALFDRFIIRFEVDYMMRPSNLRSVLTAGDPTASTVLSMDDLRSAQKEVAAVTVSDATIDALLAIRDALRAEGIIISDRRWKKSLKLAQASAWLAGEKATTAEDLAFLTDSLWREPKERGKVAKIVGKLSDPVATQAVEILDAARETATKVGNLRSGDRPAYIAAAATSLEQFNQQVAKLDKLSKTAGRRSQVVITDATSEITGMHAEIARTVAEGLGMRKRA